MKFTIPLKTESGNHGHGREHWRARSARVAKEREAIGWGWKAGRRLWPQPTLPVVVTLDRIAPRTLDAEDNLTAALKSCRDEIADWLGVDDRDPRVTWRYGQERGGARDYGVRVTIEPRAEVCPTCNRPLAPSPGPGGEG